MKKNKSLLKVVSILGTRPEIIRLSMVMPLLDKFPFLLSQSLSSLHVPFALLLASLT